ncbi:MAG: CoA transferase [Alphaproteobacteria bacterium]|nr:CoA transferase [Alphaproteobacteria bacterium]
MSLLAGLRLVQIGSGMAAAVCGRLFADAGAEVTAVAAETPTRLAAYLDEGKSIVADDTAVHAAISAAELIICEGAPAELRARQHDADSLRRMNKTAAIVFISNFGQTGPRADEPATDLTLFCASGIARLLTGQVDDLAEPPIRPVGEQSAYLGGVAAACAAMHAALADEGGATIDVSIQEALATLAITELARGGLTGESRSRKRVKDGNGATVTILPAKDGYAAISPREDRQWTAWLEVMGSPDWGADPRFARKQDRVENWDALYALMCEWSRDHTKQQIADMAQDAHVPSFPLREAAEQLDTPQLNHRKFYRSLDVAGRTVKVPGLPFRLKFTGDDAASPERPAACGASGRLPLSGVRVLDFSWVIAGPTATRYLAAMGADVIKVEAPGRGDPGRASELHTVLGQAKKCITLDLKNKDAVEIAKALAARSDVLIENFATGVMERLGLGATEMQALNPNLIYLSASGLGRTGPESNAVAYGTLLQCYAGFAGLNRHPDRPPRVGLAWLDPMCGLLIPFVATAAIWRQRRAGGGGVRIDFSMIEAMLWTMAEPLLAAQRGAAPQPLGNHSAEYVPHGVYRCAGDDDWIGIAATSDEEWRRLCAIVPSLATLVECDRDERLSRREEIDAALAEWARPMSAPSAAAVLVEIGIPAAAVASSRDLAEDPHLKRRGFWEADASGRLPGLPWRASFGRRTGAASALGEDTVAVLQETLDLSAERIAELQKSGALG